MFILALTDLLAVSYDGIVDMAFSDLGIDFDSINIHSCRILKTYSWITTMVAFFIISLLSVDKCLAVWTPVTYKIWGTPKMAIVCSLGAYVAITIACIPVPFFYLISPEIQKCIPNNQEYFTRQQFLNFVYVATFIMDFAIPVFVVSISSCGTVIKLRKMSKRRGSESNLTKREIEVTKQVAVVGILFVILCTLFSLFVTLKQQTEINSNYNLAKSEVFDKIETFCSVLNNSVNFYAYFIFGKKFRRDTLNLFGFTRQTKTERTTNNDVTGN